MADPATTPLYLTLTDPKIQEIFGKDAKTRAPMTNKNLDELVKFIEQNTGVITGDAFEQVMTDLGLESLTDLKNIFKVRDKLSALIKGGAAATPTPTRAAAATAPAASTEPATLAPARGADLDFGDPILPAGGATTTPEVTVAQTHKLVATKDPVISKASEEVAATASAANTGFGDPIDVKAETVTPVAVETAETMTVTEAAKLDEAEGIAPAAEAPVAPAGVIADTTLVTLQTNDNFGEPLTPATSTPSAATDAAVSASAEVVGGRRRAGTRTQTKAVSDTDGILRQLFTKLDEKDERIVDLEKQLAKLTDEVEKAQTEGTSTRLSAATLKKLDELGIDISPPAAPAPQA